MLWDMATSEDEDFRRTAGCGVKLRSKKVYEQEENHEREHEAQITPDVRVRILKLGFEVIVSGYSGLPYNRTGHGTDEIVAREAVGAAGGDKDGAGEALTVEFIDEDPFEGIGHGVDPRDPFEPWVHQRAGNFWRSAVKG